MRSERRGSTCAVSISSRGGNTPSSTSSNPNLLRRFRHVLENECRAWRVLALASEGDHDFGSWSTPVVEDEFVWKLSLCDDGKANVGFRENAADDRDPRPHIGKLDIRYHLAGVGAKCRKHPDDSHVERIVLAVLHDGNEDLVSVDRRGATLLVDARKRLERDPVAGLSPFVTSPESVRNFGVAPVAICRALLGGNFLSPTGRPVGPAPVTVPGQRGGSLLAGVAFNQFREGLLLAERSDRDPCLNAFDP